MLTTFKALFILFYHMAFKLKKRIHEILDMDFETYAKFLKKEIQRASKFGVLDAVVCSDHKFSDGKTSTLVLMGAFVGDLANFFKQNKTALGFAKGKCYFENNIEGCTMHLILEAGRGKPDKIAKSGRKLWAKTQVQPTFHKGQFPDFAPPLDEVNIGEEEMIAAADRENDTQALEQVRNQYNKAKKALQTLVLPLLSNTDTLSSSLTNQHFVIAKAALKANSSWSNKITESNPAIQQRLAEEQQKLIAEYPKLKRIAAKIKQTLAGLSQVDSSTPNTNSVDATQREPNSSTTDTQDS